MSADRKQQSLDVRITAAKLAFNRPHPPHIANGDEQKFRTPADGKPSYLASYTKGLPHDETTGLISKPDDFQLFVKAIDSGAEADFQSVPLGPNRDGKSESWKSAKACGVQTKKGKACPNPVKVRAWESQSAGNTFDLEGPDAQAVTMPPAPALGSAELTAEMAEVYVQALLRDVPFTEIDKYFGKGTDENAILVKAENPGEEDVVVKVKDIIDCLRRLEWFQEPSETILSPAEQSRKRKKIGVAELREEKRLTLGKWNLTCSQIVEEQT
ncbi:MAG: hypothetical protein AAGA67_07495, partial [Cyanobacteria bacterium P01_F01_bin.153]